MFFKACLMQKHVHNRKYVSNYFFYCYAQSDILQNRAQEVSTLRLFSNKFASGVPRHVENTVRNRRKSLLSFCTAAVCSNHSISSESIKASTIILGHSSICSPERYFYKIRPNYNSKPVRWYSEKKVEGSLGEEINEFVSSPDETWDAHYSSEPCRGLSNGSAFSQASVIVEGHVEAEADVLGGKENRNDPFHRKPSWSVEYDGEELLPSSATNVENIKSLSHMINNARTFSEVLEIYKDHQNELKLQHFDMIVRKLTVVQDRSMLEKTRWHSVLMHLLDRLTRDCNQYDPNMLITLLKYLSATKTQTNTPIVCTTLQSLRTQFNNLDLKQLLFVDILLKNMRQDPVVNALKMAVPLALEYRYRSEPLPSGLMPYQLIQGLSIFTKSDTADSMALAEKFMMALYEHEDSLKDLTPISTVHLIGALAMIFLRWQKKSDQSMQELLEDDEMDVAPERGSSKVQVAQQQQLAREVLFKEVLQYITTNINKLSHSEAEKVLSWLSYSYRQRDSCAYNQPMLRAYARRAIDQEWPLRSLAGVVMWMLKMTEVDESLLEALLKKIHVTSPQELQGTELYVMPLVHALAASSTFASRSVDERHALLARLLHHSSAHQQQKGDVQLPITRLGFDLAWLGYFEPDIHRKIFDYTIAETKKSGPATLQVRRKQVLLKMWQAHKLLNTKHEQLQIDDALLASCMEAVVSDHHSNPYKMASRAKVREVLLQALSAYGPNSVITAVHTRHGVCMDHVIVVRGDNEVVPQPSAAEGRRVCFDDLLVPDNARVLGVVQISLVFLLNNYTKLRPEIRLHLQLLAAENVTAVPFIMPQYGLHYRTDEERRRYVTAAFSQHRLYL